MLTFRATLPSLLEVPVNYINSGVETQDQEGLVQIPLTVPLLVVILTAPYSLLIGLASCQQFIQSGCFETDLQHLGGF